MFGNGGEIEVQKRVSPLRGVCAASVANEDFWWAGQFRERTSAAEAVPLSKTSNTKTDRLPDS
jgi:hypothetical protein